MLDLASPHENEEKHAASVSPLLTSQHASRFSTPALSSLHGTPRYLCSPPNLPSPGSSLSPPSSDMAIKAACLLEPNLRPSHGQITLEQVSSDRASLHTMQLPQRFARDFAPERAVSASNDHGDAALLSQVSHLLRVQKYHKRRSHHAQERLRSLQIAAVKTARLHRAARSVQHTLAECIKSEDKCSFANLLHAFQDACDDATRTASAAQDNAASSTGDVKPSATFLDCLSTPSKDAILDVIAKVRHDGPFLADRLTSLAHKDLMALLPDRSVSRSNESIFSASSRTGSIGSKPLGYAVDSQVESLGSRSYVSPLESLIFVPTGLLHSHHTEVERMTDVWATVSAKLIRDQKPGSERLIPALLDIWASLCPWPGRDRLETWLLETLQQGAFLLEQSGKQTFRARVEGRSDLPVEEEARTERFYTTASNSLLDILADRRAPSAIPPGALVLCRAISEKLHCSPGHQRALPSFILTRWLVSSFLMNIVNVPEAFALLTEHYVSDVSRQRILHAVAMRAQRTVFDVAYSWKHGSTLTPTSIDRVSALNLRLQGSQSDQFSKSTKAQPDAPSGAFLAISMADVTAVLSALYPRKRPASMIPVHTFYKSGLLSSASSMSGFSLFRNATAPPHLCTSLSTALPQDQSLNAHDSDASTLGANDQATDSYHIREVLLELDELSSRRASSAKELWDVVGDEDRSRTLTTFRDMCATIRRRHFQASHEPQRLNSLEQSAANALETLLKKYGTSTAAKTDPVTEYSSSLPQIRTQIEQLFEAAVHDCESTSDFVGAHYWFQQSRDVDAIMSSSGAFDTLRQISRGLEGAARVSISQATDVEGACRTWESTLPMPRALLSTYLMPALEVNRRLRDKMWYISDVRTSAPYDEARAIAHALRVMAAPKPATKVRGPPTLRHWTTTRISGTSLHSKSDAQVLEIISSKLEHGGPNKLSDAQAILTLQWMQRDNIDNLCKGEERLHKLCMEVLRCIDNVTNASTTENSILWSSSLYVRDGPFHTRHQRRSTAVRSLYDAPEYSHRMFPGGQPRSNETLSSSSHILSNASSRDFSEGRSPTLANQSSAPFWSPTSSEMDAPSSATSILSYSTRSMLDTPSTVQPNANHVVDYQSLEKLRRRITSLMLSDLTAVLFSDGSETDKAFWTGLGAELAQKQFRSSSEWPSSRDSQTPTAPAGTTPEPTAIRFDFDRAFRILLRRMSVVSNPSTKLACLHDIDRLLVPYMAEREASPVPQPLARSASGTLSLVVQTASNDATETSIRGFREIFSRSTLRPGTIFRDLQFIAALLPSSVLQSTPQGKAFCNAAVAITGLKSEARKLMVETADSIIAFHSNNRGHGRSSSTAQQQRDHATFSAPSPPAEDIGRYSMADAAYLLQITAKEGDPVAQRELATLYLTNPELMDRIIAPFARPKEVFKEEIEGRWKRNQDPNRCDPNTMCVAHHWMSLSSKGGDALATEYLKQREEMDTL